MMRRVIAASTLALAGAIVSAAEGPAQYAGRAAADVPTFSKDVAPIVYANCTSCHRPGEIAPMSFITYKDVRPWARSIRDKVSDGTMPPWHADPKHGRFANDRSLSAAAKDTIVRWVNGGAPEGDPKDLPPVPTFTEGWQLGQPDHVLQLPVEYRLPADGFVEYEYFEIPTSFTDDRWLEGLEVRPGNREVVHHVILFVRPPKPERRPTAFAMARGMEIPRGQSGGGPEADGQKRPRGQSLFPPPQRSGAMIGGFAPGNQYLKLEPGSAILLRAGSTIIAQMHYTTSGKVTTDRTTFGLYFAKAPPKVEMRMGTLVNGQLHIPAGAADYSIAAEMTTTADVTLRQLLPHTHLRGKSWEYTATYPDGRSEVILSVPKYDFNWQTDYVFAEPLKLPKGTRIRAVAHYDNSAANRANPDPTVDVKWGDQTWEEMMFTSFVYSIDGVAPGAVITTAPTAGGGH
ncbi:MAG TPA: hypothetical protein VM364_10770 [Vicinamibacterales bacterium]|nr:hypothetical protein [Vicinamibacterales bacterium]